SRRSDFVRKLVSWAKELKVNEMILLGSSSSNVRKDQQMVGPQYRYLKNDFSTLEYPRSENWIKFEPLPKYIIEVNRNENIEGGDSISIPFGGICKAVYQASNEIRMPMSAILSFTSEGNNIPDALLVIDKFSEALQISSVKFQIHFEKKDKNSVLSKVESAVERKVRKLKTQKLRSPYFLNILIRLYPCKVVKFTHALEARTGFSVPTVPTNEDSF
ncbi:hypothetical protein QYM36_003848, partial [Artemia franciscana]